MTRYPQVSIPVTIRNRNTGATSAINYGANEFGMPIDLVVPWENTFEYDDRAKITTSDAQTGTVSFGRQVGLKYRMAHIRGIQLTTEQITGTIETASAVDQQPPVYSAGDAAFQLWFLQNVPTLHFGHRTDRRGTWQANGGPMTRQQIIEIEPGRTVVKCWGRIPNSSVFKANEINNMSANSLMAMWWFYFYPETALVKWELSLWYCDAKNGAYAVKSMPMFALSVPEARLEPYVKWRDQRMTTAEAKTAYSDGVNTIYHDIIDVAAPMVFGQGMGFTGFFLDETRLAHTAADFTCLTADATYQYWINAIAQRSAWDGHTPVWGAIPPTPTSVVDPLVFDALTISKYQALMNSADASADPVFDNASLLWGSVGEGGNPTGDQPDYGHGKAAMYWGLNPDGNPDAVEMGYFGILPQHAVVGKFYHQGPDELARTDKFAPGTPDYFSNSLLGTGTPFKNGTDGSLYAINYVNGVPIMDNYLLYPKTTQGDFRVPNQDESNLVFNWVDNSGQRRGTAMLGVDTSHASNWGLMYAAITTGSWALYELMRQQTVMYMYSVHPWGHETVIVLSLEQHRAGRTFQCIVNGYWADHNPANRANIVNHLRVIAERNSDQFWVGFQSLRQASDEFYLAPNRALHFNSGPSTPNVNPAMAYPVCNPWQMGAFTGMYHMYLLTGSATMRDWLWAGWYSFVRYQWENFAVHPEEEYLRDLGQDAEADGQALKVPGWLLMAYIVTPGITVGNHNGGDGYGPDTANSDWITGTKTAEGDTRNFRTFFAGMPTNDGRIPQRSNARDITACTTGTTPTITLNAAHGLTGTFLIYFTGMFYDINETESRVLSGYTRVTATGADTLQIAAGYVDIYRAAAPGFLGDVEWGTVISISASATPVVELSAAHGRTEEFWVYFRGTNSVPALSGYYLCAPTGPTQLTLEPGQITTTQSGLLGDVQWGTPWEAPDEDEGLESQAPFNIWRDSRRYHSAPVLDWDSFYGVSAIRVGRLVSLLKPEEVDRRAFMTTRIDEILGSWNPRFHARVHAETVAGWMTLVRHMDWIFPTTYEPGGIPPITATPLINPGQWPNPASIGVTPTVVVTGGTGDGIVRSVRPDRDIGRQDDPRNEQFRLNPRRDPASLGQELPPGTVPTQARAGRYSRRKEIR